MCDYSLHSVASRPAKVGDKLVVTDFAKSITRGFAAVGEPNVAVCLLPGTEVAFEENVRYHRALTLFGKARVDHKVARFRQVNMHDQQVHQFARIPGRSDRTCHPVAHRSDWDCTSITAAAHDHVRSKDSAEERRLRSLGTTKRPVGRHIRRPTLAFSP